MHRRRRTCVAGLACASAFRQPRLRVAARRLDRYGAEEPDLADLKNLFDAQPRAPRVDDDADDDGDDGDFASLFAPPPTRDVSAAERDAFFASLKLEDIVEEEYAKSREAVRETADAQRQEGTAATREVLDEALAEVEKSEWEALAALEGSVGALVEKVGDREAAFERAMRDARAASSDMEAFERDAQAFRLAAGGAAVLLAGIAFLATQA